MTLTQIETIQQGIIEHFFSNGAGYCEVPSASDPDTKYRVYFSNLLYAISCNCMGGRHDCGHKVATDRHFDEKRTAQRKAKFAKAAEQVQKPAVAADTLDSCDLCGRPIKAGTVICPKCLGC